MIGGEHIQRSSNRVLTYNAFHTETGPTISIVAIIHEGDRLLDQPQVDLLYQPSHASLEDVVTARLVRYLNDTKFGDGKPLEKRFDWRTMGRGSKGARMPSSRATTSPSPAASYCWRQPFGLRLGRRARPIHSRTFGAPPSSPQACSRSTSIDASMRQVLWD